MRKKRLIITVIITLALILFFFSIYPPAKCVFIECLVVEVFAAVFIGWLIGRKIGGK